MKNIVIITPVYNDWESFIKLIDEIDKAISNFNEISFKLIAVNDGSIEKAPPLSLPKNIITIEILNMKINQGHTRCIATGLKYILEKENFDYVIPMDGDGEDRPEEIRELINKIDIANGKPIVGVRVKRSENLIFKIFYQFHKLITLTFTGKSIKFGNFTCLPKSTVDKLVNEKATWNSFSGSLRKIESDLETIPSMRGTRYFGPSKMSFFNLLKHSLSIMSVFRTAVLIRSSLFIIVYILMIKSNASIITATPLILLLIMIYSISSLALRENMDQFDKSLSNINDIKQIK